MRILVGFMLLASQVGAASVTLDFNSLPSAQGWTPMGSLSEGDAWSFDGTQLELNTIGLGANTAWYRLSDIVTNLPYTLEVRAKALEHENLGNEVSMFFNISTGSERTGFGLLPDAVAFAGGNDDLGGFDGTIFHDYRVEVTPGISHKLYIDDVLIFANLPLSPDLSPPNGLEFGDGTSGSNGHAIVTYYKFTQGVDPVPEPSTLLLLGTGLVGMIGYTRRQRTA